MNKSRKEFLQLDPQVISCPTVFPKGKQITLTVKCGQCKKIIKISIQNYWKRRRQVDVWRCHECIKPELIKKSKNNPLYKDKKYREKFRKLHDDLSYCRRVHNKEVHDSIAESTKKAWQDPQKRESHMRHRKTKESKERMSQWSKKKWKTEEYRNKQHVIRHTVDYHIKASEIAKALWRRDDFRNKIVSQWNNPDHRKKIIAILDKYRPMTVINKNNVSKIQKSLYLILDDLGLSYHKEGANTIVQFVNRQDRLKSFIFDCLVEHNGKKLYIESHSNYYHSSPKKMALDISKSAYSNKHTDADLLVLWESEFRDFDTIRNIIKLKLGVGIQNKNFEFSDLKIAKQLPVDKANKFFGRYHYLANMGRFNSFPVAGFIGDELVICALFNNPTRSETATRLNCTQAEVLELTRFCIHPSYHKKNFASWFLAKAVTIMRKKKKIKRFVAFSDLGQGHEGTIYKAAGWKLDGRIPPDYWYIDKQGMKYHKKSIWNRAKKSGQTEVQYAKKEELNKIYYLEKLRYIL